MSKYPVSFNICQVVINAHAGIFDDTVRTLRGALADLGYPCSVNENLFVPGAVNIALGGAMHMDTVPGLAEQMGRQPFVLYQFEQLRPGHGFLQSHPGYEGIMNAATHILEYSHVGMTHMRARGEAAKTSFLPPSYHRSLELFRPDEEPDLQVAFYGTLSDRRVALIERLRAAGVQVFTIFGVYGEELHRHLRRARIILNVHGDPAMNVLETVRLSFLLANRCCVVSETGDHNPYGEGVAFADYDQLVEACIAHLAYPEKCEALAAEGYLAVRRSDLVNDLRRVIDDLPLEALTRVGG